MKKITIFDTTLRDGLQSASEQVFPYHRVEIAKKLAGLGVDVIEAGFPASYDGDEQVVAKISREIGRTSSSPTICGLARCVRTDIEAAARATEDALYRRIHVFIATSPIHREHKLNLSTDQLLERIHASVSLAKSYTEDIEFSLEDYSRTEPGFAVQAALAAIDSGATTINLPDTVGYALPTEYHDMVKETIKEVRAAGRDAVFSVHTHNDLGYATANTLFGLIAGATQAEVTINGIGERAGNSALEEIVSTLRTKEVKNASRERMMTGIDPAHICGISDLVRRYYGMPVQANKAVVGSNAFSHKSGIHQDGMKKNGMTYEIMHPEEYGFSSRLEFGPHSGRAGLGARYAELGIVFDSESELAHSCNRFYHLAEKRKVVDDIDLVMAAHDESVIPQYWQFKAYHPISLEGNVKGMVVLMYADGVQKEAYATGVGPIDAGLNAIRSIISRNYSLEYFKEDSVTAGSDSDAIAKMVIRKNGWRAIEHGQTPDILETAFVAFTGAANRMRYMEERMEKYLKPDLQNT